MAYMAHQTQFEIEETHKIAFWPNNHLIMHSDGLGWHNLYCSVQTETPWEAVLRPAKHHCFAYCLDRSAIIHRSIDGGPEQTAILLPRQFILSPAGPRLQLRVDGCPTILLVYIHQDVIDRVAMEGLSIDPGSVELIPRIASVDALLEDLALSVLTELGRRERDSVLYVDNLAAAIALQLIARHSTHGPSKTANTSCSGRQQQSPLARLHRVRAYLQEHLSEDLTLEELAKEAKMSTRHLLRAFTRSFGAPPHQYLLRLRIERAKERLRSFDQPLVDIAAETGFSSQSHMCSAFKRLVGVSPGMYRMNN